MLSKVAASTYAVSTEYAEERVISAHEKVKKRLKYPQKTPFRLSAYRGRMS